MKWHQKAWGPVTPSLGASLRLNDCRRSVFRWSRTTADAELRRREMSMKDVDSGNH